MKKLISICIPTYNRCAKVKLAIESALSVKSELIDIIVMDNYSPDNTWSEINKLDDSRLKVFRQGKNIGFCGNLLDVVSKAETDFVFLLSDDDLINPKYVEKIIEEGLLDSCATGIIYGSIFNTHKNKFYSEYSNSLYNRLSGISEVAVKHSYMSGMILNKKYIDMKLLYQLYQCEDKLMYPHEVMVLSILQQNKDIITISDICCYQGVPGFSHIIDETVYYYYTERVYLIKQYIRITNYIYEEGVERDTIKKNIAHLATVILLNSSPLIWGKGHKKIIHRLKYYIAINSIRKMSFKFNLNIIRVLILKVLNLRF
ncbi:glycosyltransferase family 2 protein [Shewanella polaris]|uniref:Glycosyltransferase family 2 protein n=1 Tax=Shewanella polaris TaxID=2588449 RepID=A0A4Y5YCI0_9GAMM|nr:glycosyltransferase family 2 protein [Shewanella polaris]QDE30500.1 glycosyltransferase family 2 protein [Shewanella polaris]